MDSTPSATITPFLVNANTSPGNPNILAFPGKRPSPSSTTRTGCRTAPGPHASGSIRTFREGSSANTVPMPVNTAELRARKRCTSARDSAELIHRLSPSAMAVRPSRLMADLTRT